MSWKIDLHVHSKYSNKPTNWLLKKFGCSECFTEPKEIYQAAKKRGMTAFTITDHNQIAGCYEILEYPNTFISCEVTASFPEDHCKIHVLTYNITENQFKDMMQIRGNIYEFREYLLQENIYHSVAHALYSVNNKMTREHYEKLILLFNTFELNGCRSLTLNNSLKFLLDSL
ncbi:MAG: PHP domain-containing protein, partial [Candidatus Gastranaerophilaceae bacterium]